LPDLSEEVKLARIGRPHEICSADGRKFRLADRPSFWRLVGDPHRAPASSAVGVDHFDMRGSGATSFGQLTIISSAGHAQIAFGGNLIVVVNAAKQIDASDFLF
jgi:hypothetical protein